MVRAIKSEKITVQPRTARRRSVSSTLARMNLLVSGTGVLLACALFAVFSVATFRATTLTSLSTNARVVGRIAADAIRGGNPNAVKELLSVFTESPIMLSAQVLTPDGRPFAQVARDPAHVFPTPPPIPADRQ